MVSRFGGRFWIGLGLALACGASARAASMGSQGTGTAGSPLFVTGDVEKDMPSTTASSVTVIQGHPYNYVAQPDWMTNNGLINGYAMKDIRLSYDKSTDTLSVGVNFYGVAGNTDGSPDGQTNLMTIKQLGSNPANYGADKSLTVAFTPVTAAGVAANPVIVAGVPAVKANGGVTTADKFTVAAYQASTGGLTHSYGQTLTDNVGSLAYNPSSAHPDMEFTVKNFSKIPGLNALTNGFYLSAYSGSQQTVIVGKSDIANTFVAPLQNDPLPQLPVPNLPPPVVPNVPPPVPEPTTVLAWGLVAAGSAWRVRRARGRSQS